MDEVVPFPSWEYAVFFGLLLFARGMDFLSTRVATPNLVLEGNPLAKKLGWKLGIIINLLLCIAFAFLPLAAIIICTTSMLVAARNFQHAWIMRTLGEEEYRNWFVRCLFDTRFSVYLGCLLGQTLLTAAIGGALMYFSYGLITFAIGIGVLGYALTVLFYSLLSVWRIRRLMR
jgi:hypothetical protein